jgi:hypothetical protein
VLLHGMELVPNVVVGPDGHQPGLVQLPTTAVVVATGADRDTEWRAAGDGDGDRDRRRVAIWRRRRRRGHRSERTR